MNIEKYNQYMYSLRKKIRKVTRFFSEISRMVQNTKLLCNADLGPKVLTKLNVLTSYKSLPVTGQTRKSLLIQVTPSMKRFLFTLRAFLPDIFFLC